MTEPTNSRFTGLNERDGARQRKLHERELAGDAQPELAGDAQPELAGDAQPELAGDAQPELAGDAQPELAGDEAGELDGADGAGELAGGGLDEPKPLTDAAKRKAGLIPPKGGKRRDAERRRMHGALGDIERAPAWLLAAYYDEIMDLERIAKDARHALAAQGIEPHDEYGS